MDMKKNNVKQSTLFDSWARKSILNKPCQNVQGKRGSNISTAIRTDNDVAMQTSAHNFPEPNLVENLDHDFFVDDIANEVATICDDELYGHATNLSNKQPSKNLNSSLYEEIPGFDMESGQKYIYPTNFPIRDYQFNIVKKCLFKNTLVSLPTGLGKTFIAAVLMYNYYRWYPNKKVVFLAPTKPLVAQQIEACFGIMGIPQSDTAEMTGNMAPKERCVKWQSKRVFFLTPQVMQNDLGRGSCPSDDVCCVVFDEAHKALGNHAYCQVIKDLANAGGLFRVLALSATPGNDLKAVQQVITNLLISHIEIRSEESLDIQRYTFERKVEKLVVPFDGEVLDIQHRYKRILGIIVGRLAQKDVLYTTDIDRLGKFQILQARDQFRKTSNPGPQSGAVEGDLALAISLYHAYELLLQHGLRSFYQFLQSSLIEGYHSKAKLELLSNYDFKYIMQRLRTCITKDCVDSSLHLNSSMYCPSVSKDTAFFYGHPKLNRMEDVILNHFTSFQSNSDNSGQTTRVMVFSQYRDSVKEIADMLSRHAPLVRVMSFMGHGTTNRASKGQTQKEQLEVVRMFRDGGYNTLVSTCVGEEGLDIGEVDLIVCFDAHKSPVRLVQRMGRTGRKRSGRIVMIMAEGKEEQIYNKSQSVKNSIYKAIQRGSKNLQYYQFNSRMVPRHIHPVVQQVYIDPGNYQHTKEKKSAKSSAKGSNNHFSFGPNAKNDPKGVFLTKDELLYWNNNFAIPEDQSRDIECAVSTCVTHKPLVCINKQTLPVNNNTISTSRWIDWQTAPFPKRFVHDSIRTNALKSVLELSDQLQITPELSSAYDCEMMTCLNPNDVISNQDNVQDDLVERYAEDTSVKSRKKKLKRRILEDSSEDEHFQIHQKKRLKSDEYDDCGLEQIHKESNLEKVTPFSPPLEDSDHTPYNDGGGDYVPHDNSDDTSHDDNDRTPPLSQGVVPMPPNLSTIAWLDDVTSSQFLSQTPCMQTENISHHSLVGRSLLQKEFSEFKKPKKPLSTIKKPISFKKIYYPSSLENLSMTPVPALKLNQSIVSSPKLSSSTPVKEGVTTNDDYSISLLNDLPSEALFGDCQVSLTIEPSVIPESPVRGSVKPNKPLTNHKHNTIQLYTDNDPGSPNMRQKSPDKRSPVTPDIPCLKDRIAANCIAKLPVKKINTSPTIKSPKLFLDKVVVTKSSPNISRSTPSSSYIFPTPDSEEKFLKNVRTSKRVRQPFKQPDFLCSQVSSSYHPNNPIKKKHTIQWNNKTADNNTVDEDFVIQPRKRRVLFTPPSPASDSNKSCSSRMGDNRGSLIDEEAVLSGDSSSTNEQDLLTGHEYDYDDSFINDNSVLTQHVTAIELKKQLTDNIPDNMYLRSLRSPGNMFSRTNNANGNKYRLVYSQRYELLNKYVEKAGFKVSPSARNRRKNDAIFESEESEAEEIMKVNDDPEITSQEYNNMFEDENEEIINENDYHTEVQSEVDTDDTHSLEDSQQILYNHEHTMTQICGKTKLTSREHDVEPIVLSSSSDDERDTCQNVNKLKNKGIRMTIAELISQGVIVSPSLVINPSDEELPVEFAFDAPFNLGIIPRSEIIDTRSTCNPIIIADEDPVLLLDNEVPLKDEELEQFMDVNSDIDLFSNDEDSNGHSNTVYCNDDNQTGTSNPSNHSLVNVPVACTIPVVTTCASDSKETHLVSPINNGSRGNDTIIANTTNDSNSVFTVMAANNRRIILMDSKELVFSQVVSYLRHKEGIIVEVCPMGQGGGYTISNRAILERRTHSDVSTVSSSKKLIARIRHLEELYDKVYIVFETVSNEKHQIGKTKKNTDGQFESTLAKLTSLRNVCIMYSHSQESTSAIIAQLVKSEYHKGYGISLPLTLINTSSNTLKLLLKTPGMTFVTALNLIASFGNISSMVSCLSPNDMIKRLNYLSRKKAKSFIDFFHKQFNHHLTC